MAIFFFSSRRRHTRFKCDWSSDVCSSDLAGRFRTEKDSIVVVDESDGQTLHVPPPARELPERMEKFLAFANDKGSEPFVHPVVRAVLLHFWLAYEHPYVDGNGRTARAVFYWYMLTQNYWLFEYLSISRILLKSAGHT